MSDQIYITIAKVLDGEATEADEKELRVWLASDEAHAREYESLKLFWQKSDDMMHEQPVFNTAAAWDKVAAKTIDMPAPRLAVPEQPKGKTIAFPTWGKLGLAAAAALLIGLFVIKQGSGPDMVTAFAENGNLEVILPDNSHITIREGSTLKYPEKFASNERNVTLEGEAFFDVARDESKPFIIDAQSATVQVLGTSFNVRSGEHAASVVVVTGKVKMAMRKDASKALILTPGEKGLLQDGDLKEEAANAGNYISWKTGTLSFKEQPFKSIINELSAITNTMIHFQLTEAQQQLLVTVSFKEKQPLEDMLTELCLITNTKWAKETEAYYISPK
jgi:transmembrane sensor